MLRRLLEETQRALHTQDPIGRVDFLAGVIQPYAGWALRWAIEDARRQGHSWATISSLVGRPYPTILRQLQAGGPVYAHHPAQSRTSGNFDAQTPLRRAATELAQRMAALAMRDPDSVTNFYLRDRVLKLSDAQGVIDNPAPMLEATKLVVATARNIKSEVRSRDTMSEWERDVWPVLDELDACYQRDRREIETAHKVMADAGMLPDTSA
jgi:hypothetical protein